MRETHKSNNMTDDYHTDKNHKQSWATHHIGLAMLILVLSRYSEIGQSVLFLLGV